MMSHQVAIMKWTPGNRDDVDDERGSGGGLGGRMVPLGIGGVLVLAVLSWATGTDYLSLLSNDTSVSQPASSSAPASTNPGEARDADLAGAVMKDVQDTWSELLGSKYQRTRVVLFRDAYESGCGLAQSATGPFYCPEDQKVYLDLGFFDELRSRFGAPGEFARAYVIAHEVGHHVQQLTGTADRVRQAQHAQPSSANAQSVRLELQADCYAGVWGHAASMPGRAARGQVELEAGDAEAGLNAAAAIGDDRLQRMATGHVAPERFTHGSSAQRVEWFRRGLTSGRREDCDTFGRDR
jgi:predicted metalloprotease